MSSAGCPESEELRALIAGLLDTDEEVRLSQHLDHCADCQQQLERVAGQTELLENVQQRLGADDVESPDMATVIRRFHADMADSQEGTQAEVTGWGEDFSTVAESLVEAEPSEQPPPNMLDGIELVQEIGRGGMGVVYRGYETSLDRDVAVKVLARRLAAFPEARERFRREARSLAALRHPYVVMIYRIVDPLTTDAAGQPLCLVMEYVDGESLEKRIRRKGPLPVHEVIRTSIQIAAGLAAAHEQDIIHRDVKPANILLKRSPRQVKLTDFGLARAVDEVMLTRSGTLVGTPGYMSPEQVDGRRVDHRTDLFSLGSVMHAMLTGRPPFAADTAMNTMGRILNDTVDPIELTRSDVPDWLSQTINTLHAKDPADRFQTAEDVVWLLQERRAELPGVINQRTPPAGPESKRRQSTQSGKTDQSPQQDERPSQTGFMVLGGVAVALLLALAFDLPGFFDAPASAPPDIEEQFPAVTSQTRREGGPAGKVPGVQREFVVLVDGQSDGRSYESLGQAVAQAPDGAIVELHTDGPVFTPPLHAGNRRLTIRAARGFRPKVILGQRLQGSDTALVVSSGQLQLEGLSLAVDNRPPGDEAVPNVVCCTDGSVRMANCRLSLLEGDACLKLNRAADSVVQNCELFSAGAAGIEWIPGTDARLTVRNTLQTGLYAVAVHHQTTDIGRPLLRMERSTMSTIHALRWIVPMGASADTDTNQPLTVATDQAVLDVRDSVLQFDIPEDQRAADGPFQPWEVPERIRSAIVWKDRSTLFSEPRDYMSWQPSSEKADWPPWQPQHLFGWSRFWNTDLRSESRSERISYQYGRPTRTGIPLPTDVAQEFEVAQGSEDARGEKPGIDPLIVGPGDAFDRWRSTPAWDSWSASGQ